jgi:hypothetical protein
MNATQTYKPGSKAMAKSKINKAVSSAKLIRNRTTRNWANKAIKAAKARNWDACDHALDNLEYRAAHWCNRADCGCAVAVIKALG